MIKKLVDEFDSRCALIHRALSVGLLTIALSACGGGGDNSSSAIGSDGTPSPAGGPTGSAPGNARRSDVAPVAGAFGGGEGQILFVDGGQSSVWQLDLASRLFRKIAEPNSHWDWSILDGVTRSTTGSFAVLSRKFLGLESQVFVFSADGSLINATSITYMNGHAVSGAAISPEGRLVAWVEEDQPGLYSRDYRLFTRLRVWDIVARLLWSVTIQERPDRDSRDPAYSDSFTAYWTPEGELKVLAIDGIYDIDLANLTSRRAKNLALSYPRSPVVGPDGQTLFFQQSRGNVFNGTNHPTIWSLDPVTDTLTRRSVYSGLGQFSPAVSPDGQWLLMTEAVGSYALGILSESRFVTAVRLSDQPFDTNGVPNEILGAQGARFTADGRVAWF